MLIILQLSDSKDCPVAQERHRYMIDAQSTQQYIVSHNLDNPL